MPILLRGNVFLRANEQLAALTDSIASDDFSMDCCICYAYKLNNDVPEVTCADTRCGQLFHSECLIEWIRSLPNFRQSFNVLFGECPYCSTVKYIISGGKCGPGNRGLFCGAPVTVPLTVKMCRKAKALTKK